MFGLLVKGLVVFQDCSVVDVLLMAGFGGKCMFCVKGFVEGSVNFVRILCCQLSDKVGQFNCVNFEFTYVNRWFT